MESSGEVWRVIESYQELWRTMVNKFHITLKQDHTRAIEIYGELHRTMGKILKLNIDHNKSMLENKLFANKF